MQRDEQMCPGCGRLWPVTARKCVCGKALSGIPPVIAPPKSLHFLPQGKASAAVAGAIGTLILVLFIWTNHFTPGAPNLFQSHASVSNIEFGMTQSEVESMVGTPDHRQSIDLPGQNSTFWYFNGMRDQIGFQNGKVNSISHF